MQVDNIKMVVNRLYNCNNLPKEPNLHIVFEKSVSKYERD